MTNKQQEHLTVAANHNGIMGKQVAVNEQLRIKAYVEYC